MQFSVISFHSKPIEIEFTNLSLVFGPSLHQMSHKTSFIQHRNDPDEGRLGAEDSESSYDSTNAFNVHHHSLKDPHKQKSSRANPAVLTQDDPFGHLAQHKTWKEHQKFL